MLNNEQIQNNWPRIKTQVLAKWNKLSEADIEKTHGNPHSLHHLVNTKYGNIPNFDKTYEKICESCIPSSRRPSIKTEIENRPATSPSAEAGMHASTTERTDKTIDDTFHAGSPERRANANYAHVGYDEGNADQDQRNDYETNGEFEREFGDELSAYSPNSADRLPLDEDNSEFIKLDKKNNTQFTAPDEFYPSQDPMPSHEDITLGRGQTSSATKISTAKAASKSSEVSSNDAKKKT